MQKNSEFAHTKCYWPYQPVGNGMAGNIKKQKKRSSCIILVGKSEEKITLERPWST
jgi:hypothetical protein